MLSSLWAKLSSSCGAPLATGHPSAQLLRPSSTQPSPAWFTAALLVDVIRQAAAAVAVFLARDGEGQARVSSSSSNIVPPFFSVRYRFAVDLVADRDGQAQEGPH